MHLLMTTFSRDIIERRNQGCYGLWTMVENSYNLFNLIIKYFKTYYYFCVLIKI